MMYEYFSKVCSAVWCVNGELVEFHFLFIFLNL